MWYDGSIACGLYSRTGKADLDEGEVNGSFFKTRFSNFFNFVISVPNIFLLLKNIKHSQWLY